MKSSVHIEEAICGFLGGAMVMFNLGLWALPHLGILSPAATIALCMAGGMGASILMLRSA